MQKEPNALSERLLDFAANVVRLTPKLSRTSGCRHIASQLVRSATSCGANYQEACAAESKADFIHKMQVVLKELRESLYWLKLAQKTAPGLDGTVLTMAKEAEELVRIFSKSVVTAKGGRQ